MSGADSSDGSFDDGVRRVGIADALREVDALDGITHDGHGTDL